MISYIQRKPLKMEEISKILEISVNNNHFTNNGPVKRALEEHLENLINIPNDKRVLCVANGTVALYALVAMYEMKYNKPLKWITPSFTFPSCVTNNLNTEIFDISSKTYTIDETIIKDTDFDGIIITNLFGTRVNFDYSKYSDKIIICDNASSFMTPDIMLLGDSSFSSLHHTKTLGFGEGGFIVCDKDDYDILQSITNFGFSSNNRIYSPNSSNYKMSDVSATFILHHIKNYDIQRHYDVQYELVHQIGNDKIFNYNMDVFYGNLPILFKNKAESNYFTGIIEVNKYYKPLSQTLNSTQLYDRILNFPLYNTLTSSEIYTMSEYIKKYYDIIS